MSPAPHDGAARRPEPGGPPGRPRRGRQHAAAALLAAPVAASVAVPAYDRAEPALAAVPFFYWAQLAVVPFAAVCLAAAYLLQGEGAR